LTEYFSKHKSIQSPMNQYPKISIVTPNFNGEKYLEETILSVVEQNYPNLEYIIIDGGSTDGSLDIIHRYEKHLAYFESEKDHGLYYALQKGFTRSTGEIMGWINSDDILFYKSLFSITEIFSVSPEINWIQGYPTVIDDIGRVVYHRPQVWSKLFFYLKDYSDGRFIQQESTFWTRSLWEKAGSYISTDYKYAGDFELWIRFFHHEQQYLTNSILGSFRVRREGQMSKAFYNDYLIECDRIIDTNLKILSDQEQEVLKDIKAKRNSGEYYPLNDEIQGKPVTVNYDLSTFAYRMD